MPIQTDTTVSPYYDDYNPTKDYYKILFRPGVAVQVRELNQLQSIMQKQIERFGDNIFKRGTIVDGCSFTFETALPYVKINDTTNDSAIANVASYTGLAIKKNSNNHKAYITHVENGYISTNPDLKTLYLKYRNSGSDNQTNVYSAGDSLTIYNDDYRLYSIKVIDGSTGFTNNDSIVITSSIALQNSTGGTSFNASFQVGDLLTQTTTNAHVEVVSVDTTSNTSAVILRIKPQSSDLAAQNTVGWAISSGYEVTGNTSGAVANVVSLVGTGATATLTTTGADNRIGSITITSGGSGYYVAPYASISSSSATSGEITTLDLNPRNYLDIVTVAPANTTPVGVGYGMHVSTGVIYQKGYFERVAKQFSLVSKYSNTQSDVVVGFTTTESVVNSNSDSTLLDNASGFLNENAPGANRLKLVPVLTTKTKTAAEQDSEFFPLVEFSEGKPFKQFRSTQYNKITDEMARRTSEESGNYVLDPFLMTTQSVTTFANEANNFNIVIDPGHAYINGYRVQTLQNYTTSIDKSKDFISATNQSIDITYGNYIKVTDVGGSWDFTEGSQVSLRDTATDYYSLATGTSITAGSGTEIGKARVRSLIYESGIPGTPEAIYRMYLFDIKMNSGKNFRDIRSLYYNNGTFDAVADVKLEVDGSTGANIAVLKEPNNNFLIFGSDKIKALKAASSLSYIYRTIDETATIAAGGTMTLSPSINEQFVYTGALSLNELEDIVVIPVNDTVNTVNIAGSIAYSGNVITGTATSFVTELEVGDYIQLKDTGLGNTDIIRVTSITNSTSLSVHTNIDTNLGATSNAAIAFPKNVPIPLSTRSGRSATMSGSDLIVNFGVTLSGSATVSAMYNLKTSSTHASLSSTKSTDRKVYVKINTASHTAGTTGPWCLGHSDIFRLRAVYAGATTSDTNITKHFYIDHNQNENFYDLGFLYKRPTSSYTPSGTLLVEFDIFTESAPVGLRTLESYTINDDKTLSELDGNESLGINTLELPEVYSKSGRYFDLRDSFDFRPLTANTADRAASAGAATTNPSEATESTRFASGNKYFPVPQSDLYLDYDYYKGRVDTVLVKSSGDIVVLNDERRLEGNKDEIILNHVYIPPYPSLPENYSTSLIEILDKSIANERFNTRREEKYKIISSQVSNQPRGYSMAEIGKLDRRIEALEYYANLSQIEKDLKDKVIPSQIDITLERYKFGFFVDDFTTKQFADLKNPEYNASIFEYKLYPKKDVLSLEYKISSNSVNTPINTGGTATFPYENYTLISQNNATNGPLVAANTTANTVPDYNTECVDVFVNGSTFAANGSVYDERVFTFTANTDSNGVEAILYFHAYTNKDRWEIYQSTNSSSFTGDPVITSESANNLTQANKNYLTNLGVNDLEWNTLPNFEWETKDANSKYWVTNAGKLSFNYSTSGGRYFKVRVIKGSPRHFYRFCFPSDDLGTTVVDGPLTPVITKPEPVIETKPITYVTVDPWDDYDNSDVINSINGDDVQLRGLIYCNGRYMTWEEFLDDC